VLAVSRRGLLVLTALQVAVFGGARPALGGMVILAHSKGGAATTYSHEGDVLRLDSADGTWLFDLRRQRFVVLYDAERAFFDVGKGMHAFRKPLRRLLREMPTPPPSPPSSFVAVHDKRTVGDFSCEAYDEFVDGRVVRELCVIPWGPAIGQAKDYAWITSSTTIMAGMLETSGLRYGNNGPLKAFVDPLHLPGLPVLREIIGVDHRRTEDWRIDRVERRTLPPSLFEVPAGYAELDEFLDTPAPPRSTEGAATERAFAPAHESASSGLRLTGIVVLALLFVCGIGILSHAALLYFASLFVIEGARFSSACFAVLILWTVTVPLELLHVWRPAEAALSLVAAFGSLKLAYRTSTARTFALLAVSAVITILIAVVLVALGFAGRR
jgi:hypothetical protein